MGGLAESSRHWNPIPALFSCLNPPGMEPHPCSSSFFPISRLRSPLQLLGSQPHPHQRSAQDVFSTSRRVPWAKHAHSLNPRPSPRRLPPTITAIRGGNARSGWVQAGRNFIMEVAPAPRVCGAQRWPRAPLLFQRAAAGALRILPSGLQTLFSNSAMPCTPPDRLMSPACESPTSVTSQEFGPHTCLFPPRQAPG